MKCDKCGEQLYKGKNVKTNQFVLACMNSECDLSIFKKGEAANIPIKEECELSSLYNNLKDNKIEESQ